MKFQWRLRLLPSTPCASAILTEQVRIDGRGLTDIRQLTAEVEVLPRVHGSAIFERGEPRLWA